MFFDNVPFDKEFVFKVKIFKTKKRQILIGVVDYDKQKDQEHSSNSNNAVGYFLDGCKYPSGIEEGNGFSEGETV